MILIYSVNNRPYKNEYVKCNQPAAVTSYPFPLSPSHCLPFNLAQAPKFFNDEYGDRQYTNSEPVPRKDRRVINQAAQ